MHHLLDVLALLAVGLIFSKILGGIAEKYGKPSVLAELFTGILLGNLELFGLKAFTTLETSAMVQGLSELGVLFLLFVVGLETDIREIGKVGKDATLAAVFGVLAPVALAFTVIPFVASGSGFEHTLFIAAALSATSVGITARVLRDAKKLNSVSGQIILGAAVIDDVLGIIILAVVSALVTKGGVSFLELVILFLKIALFGVGVAVFRRQLMPVFLKKTQGLQVPGTVTILLISLCLLCAWAAESMGLAGIVGAFALGVALDDAQFKSYKEAQSVRLEQLMKPITDFLSPVFFVVMGMGVKLKALANTEALFLGMVLIVCGILGKLACGLAVRKQSLLRGADKLLVGVGMIPRGEVGLIFAAMGLKLGVLNNSDYASVVLMVAVTTLLAPELISWRIRALSKNPV
jgi:Kef-type K+ transport system membrane component KefB